MRSANFLQLMPVPMGSEVKNRLFDTEPMSRPSVASLNIFVDEGSNVCFYQFILKMHFHFETLF